ncbi:MAG: hypothetical protein DELT_00519 [Desulfovibrio sp.]
METAITTHAIRQIKKLPQDVRTAVMAAIDALAEWPDVANVKNLKNRSDYRLRVGRYRVIFEVAENTIWITHVVIRDDNTY